MAAVVALKVDNLAVEPGQTTSGELSLANTGTIVEQFTILVLGDAAEWTQVEPPVVSLFPQGQQTVTLRFSPPRVHTTPTGFIEFAVKVIPSNEPEESVVEEGAINVGTFNDVGAELVPRVTTGRFSGRQRLAVDSRGNVPVPVTVTAIDAAEALKFRIRPSMMTTAPGEARFAKLSVKPRQRFWRGRPQQKPYKVQVAAGDEKPVVLDGGLTQKAVLPKWLLPLLGILALLLLLWFLVLRPIVKSTAVTASAAQLAAQAAQTRSLASQLAATKSQVAALSGAKPGTPPTTAAPGAPSTTAAGTTVAGSSTTAKPAAGSSTTKPGSSTTAAPPGGPTSFTGPNDGRLYVNTTGTASDPILIAPGDTLNVNDVILENNAAYGPPQGDQAPGAPPQYPGDYGTVKLQRILPPPAPGQPPVVQNLLVEDLTKLIPGVEFRLSSPMQFVAGETINLQVICGAGTTCVASAYYNGPITKPAGP